MHSHVIIVGAQRSGTTFLYQALDSHPDACMAKPIRPEPKFFLREDAVALGRAGYLAAHFQHARDERVLGEKSTSYIEYEDVAIRIRNMLPAARIVMVLRDPVLRAYSNWRFSRDHGAEVLAFDEALDAEDERCRAWDKKKYSVCPVAYATRGDYVRYMNMWARHFPREQLVLVTSESLFAGEEVAWSTLLGRLGLDPEIPVATQGRINASDEAGEISPAAMARLRARFRETNRRLGEEWGVDISSWLT
jgi:hypothetical protein